MKLSLVFWKVLVFLLSRNSIEWRFVIWPTQIVVSILGKKFLACAYNWLIAYTVFTAYTLVMIILRKL